MPDLIQCTDHGDAGLLATWRLHAWRPGGFEQSGTVIPPLDGYSCGMEVHTVDIDHNGITDLVMPGLTNVGGQPGVATGAHVVCA